MFKNFITRTAMFQQWTSRFLIVVIAMLMIVNLDSPAQAANCGGNTPCGCGDNVTQSRTLTATDPVVVKACDGHGLVMNTAGVTVDLGGRFIIGSGGGVGVLILNVDGVIIRNGQIHNFETGIATASGGTTDNSTIESIKPDSNNGDGIRLEGNGNQLLDILAKRSGNNGVAVIGNQNLIQDHNDEYSGFHGIFVQGDFNDLVGNYASENANDGPGAGIRVEGNHNTLTQNRMTKLNSVGIEVVGNDNLLDGNLVRKQKGSGIVVDGDANVLAKNRVTDNKGFGIVVTGNGDANDSKDNILSSNRLDPECLIYGVMTPPACIVK